MQRAAKVNTWCFECLDCAMRKVVLHWMARKPAICQKYSAIHIHLHIHIHNSDCAIHDLSCKKQKTVRFATLDVVGIATYLRGTPLTPQPIPDTQPHFGTSRYLSLQGQVSHGLPSLSPLPIHRDYSGAIKGTQMSCNKCN